MNIDPLSTGGIPLNGAHRSTPQNGEIHSMPGNPRDSLSVERSMAIDNTMSRIPEIRPEVVARGKALLADSNYPGPQITEKIAALIVPFDTSD